MKTIAISIEEPMVDALDQLARAGTSRSEVVREAIGEYLERRARLEREQQERRVIAEHRELLARQAAALVSEQAVG